MRVHLGVPLLFPIGEEDDVPLLREDVNSFLVEALYLEGDALHIQLPVFHATLGPFFSPDRHCRFIA